MGTTLYDFCDKDCANSIHKIDNKVMLSAIPYYGIEESVLTDSSLAAYLTIKMPLYGEKGDLAGLFGVSISLKKFSLVNLANLCKNFGVDITQAEPHKSLENFCHNRIVCGVRLSKRQYDCLIHLIHGKTTKEIARILDLSTRTVESYIETLKIKLNCYSKAQLIDKLQSWV